MHDIPGFLLVITIWAYWIGVGVMVTHVTHKKPRHAGLVPKLRTERLMWVIWMPVILAWLALPTAALVKSKSSWLLVDLREADLVFQGLRWVASVCALLCFLGTVECWKRMGENWRMSVLPGQRTELVTQGLYARIRHPIYALSILLISCSVAIVPVLPMFIVALFHIVLMILKALYEERFLLQIHGEKFRVYREHTGRFLPRLRRANSPPRARSQRMNLFQEAMVLWEELHPYNACHIVRLKGKVNETSLYEAIKEACRFSGLGNLTVDKKNRCYHYEPQLNIELFAIERRNNPLQAMEKAVTAEMNRPFPSGPHHPIRWYYLNDPQSYSHFLIVAYQHLAADSFSMRLLIRDVLNRYFCPRKPMDRDRLEVLLAEGKEAFRRFHRLSCYLKSITHSSHLYFRLRQVYRLHEKGDGGETTSFRFFKTREGLADSLISACKRRGITLHEALIGALMVVLGELTLQQRTHHTRKGLALATILDVRQEANVDLSSSFGVYLRPCVLALKEPEIFDFETLLQTLAAQMRFEKSKKTFMRAPVFFWYIVRSPKWFPFENTWEWYRKVYPLSAGLSYVKLQSSWFGESSEQILDYIRVSPTGPALPLVFTPTTFKGELNFSLVWRNSVFVSQEVERLVDILIKKLEYLVET